MPPAAFLHPQNAPKSLAVPQTPLGELATLRGPIDPWIKGPALLMGGEKEEGN